VVFLDKAIKEEVQWISSSGGDEIAFTDLISNARGCPFEKEPYQLEGGGLFSKTGKNSRVSLRNSEVRI
jgi:hypothetical protein